jgi:hypothetical protein
MRIRNETCRFINYARLYTKQMSPLPQGSRAALGVQTKISEANYTYYQDVQSIQHQLL